MAEAEVEDAARPWPPPAGAYAEERGLFQLLQVNGEPPAAPPRGRRRRGAADACGSGLACVRVREAAMGCLI